MISIVRCIFIILIFFKAIAGYSESIHVGLVINYDTAMSHVDKKNLHIVNEIARIYSLFPNANILLAGHTDTVGSYEMNVELSRGRAEILKTLLVKRGVNKDKVETIWFSYDAPIASNLTVDGRAKNRRTVLSFYNLTLFEKDELTIVISKNKGMYVIAPENEKVDDHIKNLLQSKNTLAMENENTSDLDDLKKTSPTDNFQNTTEENAIKDDLDNSSDLVIPNDISIDRLPTADPEIIYNKNKTQINSLAADQNNPYNSNHRYYIGIGNPDNRLVAKRSGFKAIWLTDLNTDLAISYQTLISQKNWLGFSGKYQMQSYKSEDNLFYTALGEASNLLNVSIDYDYQANDRWNYEANINYIEENFIISNGLNVELNKGSYLNISAGGAYKFLKKKKYSSRINFNLLYPIAGLNNIKISGSLGYLILLDFSFKEIFKNHELNLGLVHGFNNLENLQNQQTNIYYGLEIKLRNKNWF